MLHAFSSNCISRSSHLGDLSELKLFVTFAFTAFTTQQSLPPFR